MQNKIDLEVVARIGRFPVAILTKDIAVKYQSDITKIWNLIPLSQHAVGDILKESKKGKEYLGKWKHSLIVFNETLDNVIAFIVGYEVAAEDSMMYPKTRIHLKSMSVTKDYQRQGIGRKLLEIWLSYNRELSYHHLDDELMFSVQTNGADFNKGVQTFYESVGFKKVTEKVYPNKTDYIYYLKNNATH